MALNKLVTKRMLKKTTNFRDSQKKNNRSYFKHVGATVKTRVSGQIVTIKQERVLVSRFLAAVKSRTDFVIKKPSEILNLMWSHHLIFTQIDQ